MNPFKQKKFVFIVSAGRTGTKFLGDCLSDNIEDCYSVHEPDVLTLERGYGFIDKIRTFGTYHILFGRLLGKTGIRNLSESFLTGRMTLETLRKKLIEHRDKYYQQISQRLIIESYSGWYGCLSALDGLYRDYRVLIISRDPKTWIESVLNFQNLYGKRDWVTRLGFNRLNPLQLYQEPHASNWNHYSDFEKICWTYTCYYSTLLRYHRSNNASMLVKFEDLFYSDNRRQVLHDVLQYITVFDSIRFDHQLEQILNESPIHSSRSNQKNQFAQWTSKQKDAFYRICWPLAEELNYD